MNEKKPESLMPHRPTISHEEVIADPALWDRYKNERVTLIKAGEPIWMLRGIDTGDMEPGLVMDYYENGGLMGFIEGDDLDGYHIYGPDVAEGEGPHHLNTEPVSPLNEAQRKLTDYIKSTSLE